MAFGRMDHRTCVFCAGIERSLARQWGVIANGRAQALEDRRWNVLSQPRSRVDQQNKTVALLLTVHHQVRRSSKGHYMSELTSAVSVLVLPNRKPKRGLMFRGNRMRDAMQVDPLSRVCVDQAVQA